MGSLGAESSFFLNFQGLNQLAAQGRHDSPAALRAAARQFEALFLQMMLKSMRKATQTFQSGLLSSDQTRFYQGLADQQLALSMAQESGLGLAKLLVEQFGGHPGAGTAAAKAGQPVALHRPLAPLPVRRAPPATPAEPPSVSTPAAAGAAPETSTGASAEVSTAAVTGAGQGTAAPGQGPLGFVRRIWPLARAAGAALGVGPAVLVAQAALETGWGRTLARHPDGRSAHNLFGIKAGPGWSGPAVTRPTVEFRGGQAIRAVDRFRAYGSDAESFADYVRLLRSDPRYRAALAGAADPQEFTGALQAAGYATDPHYARKIQEVLDGPTLQEALAGLKSGDSGPLT